MYWFRNDYSQGAEPRVLDRIVRENMTATAGYGEDDLCERARALIQRETGRRTRWCGSSPAALRPTS